MCEKCKAINETIVRYRVIRDRVTDHALIARAKELIAELEADRSAMHA